MQRSLDVSDFMTSPDPRPHLKLLVPLDGSESAERALAMLRLLQPAAVLEVVLCSVVDDREFDGYPEAGIVQRETRLRTVYLEERRQALEEVGIAGESVAAHGRPQGQF